MSKKTLLTGLLLVAALLIMFLEGRTHALPTTAICHTADPTFPNGYEYVPGALDVWVLYSDENGNEIGPIPGAFIHAEALHNNSCDKDPTCPFHPRTEIDGPGCGFSADGMTDSRGFTHLEPLNCGHNNFALRVVSGLPPNVRYVGSRFNDGGLNQVDISQLELLNGRVDVVKLYYLPAPTPTSTPTPIPTPTPTPTPPPIGGIVCPYNSTQARVQKDLNDPWDRFKTINSGQQIRVGGFHDGTGLLAGDVRLNVTGPQNSTNIGNGSFITPASVGDYILHVTTILQTGTNCEDRAFFQVFSAPTPTSTPTPTPTLTPIPTSTPTPTSSPTPTSISTPTPTPTPTQFAVILQQPPPPQIILAQAAPPPQPSPQVIVRIPPPRVLPAAAPPVLPKTGFEMFFLVSVVVGIGLLGRKLRRRYKL